MHATRARANSNGPALVSTLAVSVKNGVAMDFRVVNAGSKRLEVNFPSGKTHEVIVVAPGPGFVWTDGFWDLRAGNWSWVSGRWVHPPRLRAVWVPGNWSQTHRGWTLRRGYWR